MTTPSDTQTPAPSTSGSAEGQEQPTKKPRNRKPSKKPIPHSSTLRGLWGRARPNGGATPATADESKTDDSEECESVKVKPGEPLVFRVAPSKLAAALSLVLPRPLTPPPNSLPDVVPETYTQQSTVETNATPKSRSGKKIRGSPETSSEGARRSPRNHSKSLDGIGEKAAVQTHPFFMGNAARQVLLASAVSVNEEAPEQDEPPRKRHKSADPQSEQHKLPSKPIQSHVARSLHPFFMSRTASMESNASQSSMPLLPLPQGRTVYLGNGHPARFPPRGMNHIYERDTPSIPKQNPIPIKLKKGKSTHRTIHVALSEYSAPIPCHPTIDFIPPQKFIIPRTTVIEQAKSLLKPNSHHALLRAFQILLNEDRTADPDGLAWTHKFRPRRANEVLTSNNAPTVLREWIAGHRKHVTPSQEMDDFIVDDDLDYTSPKKARRRKQREVFSGYSNVVILSGPHGVGKSACVEACAEELGYQVFEISPGVKRGGKEVLEMIGEVGQSELVTKHRGVTTAPSLEQINGQVSINDTTTLKSKGRKALICLEEVDVLYEEDKGFWGSVTSFVEKSRRPVVMTCNDPSVIPENFANCTHIEFTSADSELVRDYLRIVTLSQGHIIDPSLFERLYLECKRDFRQTLTKVQFWCQFSIGDTRSGADWVNWGGNELDWVISRGTYLDGVEWRQEAALGGETVLETVEVETPELDIDDLFMPHHFEDFPSVSPQSMFKRQKSVFRAIDHISRFLNSLSFLDCTVDRQFTAYEITPFVSPSSDDVFSDHVLRTHPGRRHEKPQGVERRWLPGIQYLSRTILKNVLGGEGYSVPSLTPEKMTGQLVKDFLYPRAYVRPDHVSDALDGVLYHSVAYTEDKFQPTLGTMHTRQTIATEVAPQIRNILRTESHRQRQPPQTVSLENLWMNIRKTRGKVKEEQEGKKRYFDARVMDHDIVLKTWMDIPPESRDNELIQEMVEEEE